jgi:hypothetical protein
LESFHIITDARLVVAVSTGKSQHPQNKPGKDNNKQNNKQIFFGQLHDYLRKRSVTLAWRPMCFTLASILVSLPLLISEK